MSEYLLNAQNIAKRYGATVALARGNLRVRPGRTHVLLGENGAGKSTLLRIVVGAAAPSEGVVQFDGTRIHSFSVHEAGRRGIVPVYQHLSLFPNLTVLENLSVFGFAGGDFSSVKRQLVSRATATAWLEAVGLSVALDWPVADLSVGEKQLVEIARAIGRDCKLLVLDEPTSALTARESDRLIGIVRDLCRRGTAVLFVSHKMDEVAAVADDVSVLCDGRTVVDCVAYADTTEADLLEAMLGAPISAIHRQLPVPGDETVLEARDIRVRTHTDPSELHIRRGEIVGITGLVGSGALELGEVLAGARIPAAGKVDVEGVALALGDRVAAIGRGIGYVPGDRHSHGLFPVLPALTNASASLTRHLSRFGILSGRRESAALTPWLRRLNVQPFNLDLTAAQFSGGNQQKMVVARNMALPHLKLLVLLEPTRGVDVGARRLIHDTIVAAAQDGVAVLIASSDLDEILALSHRIYVIKDHAVRSELQDGATRSAIMDALATVTSEGIPA